MPMSFDEIILDAVNAGRETWADLEPATRAKLVRLYFEQYGEWSEVFSDDMTRALDGFEALDFAYLGLELATKMTAYVRPYVNKQLAYQAMSKREQEEMRETA